MHANGIVGVVQDSVVPAGDGRQRCRELGPQLGMSDQRAEFGSKPVVPLGPPASVASRPRRRVSSEPSARSSLCPRPGRAGLEPLVPERRSCGLSPAGEVQGDRLTGLEIEYRRAGVAPERRAVVVHQLFLLADGGDVTWCQALDVVHRPEDPIHLVGNTGASPSRDTR